MKSIRIAILMAIAAIILGSCAKEPTSLFTVDKTEVYVGDVVSFTNQSSDADTYQWDFGDGKTSSEVNPIHSYESAGTYTVTLIASTKKNSSSYNMTLTVKRPNEFVVSNTHYPVNNVVVLCSESVDGNVYEIYLLNGEIHFNQNYDHFLGNGSALGIILYATSFEIGTYMISNNVYATLGTCENVEAYINYNYSTGTAMEREANSGYVFVSKEGNNYIIEVDCLDESGSKITGYVETPITIINL